MQEYYRQATMAIVPSVWPEPIATWGLEVMRYGLPVVGFDAGGISDWLKNDQTGYLIPWMDIGKMAERIDYLLHHKEEARRLGQNAQQFIRTHYDFDRYIVRLQDKLLEIADE
jgi:glycosyltransferase involved in cell wall biosynthesis